MKGIIVPVDFSKTAAHALDFAVQIARKKHFPLTVLHIVEFPVGSIVDPVGISVPPVYDPEFTDLLLEKGKEKMKEFLSKYKDLPNLESKVEIGNPYSGISDKLSDDAYDLIIMGTKGVTGLREFFIGSNTEKVVRTAHCPVIAVRDKVELAEVKDIAFATDGREVSEDLMAHLKQLQDILNGKLHIVRINTPNRFEKDRLIKPLLEKLAQRFMLTNYTVNVYNDQYEEEGIMNFSEKIDADIIALGTHGRRGLSHFMLGSLAEDVVNHTHKLIWTYHIKRD